MIGSAPRGSLNGSDCRAFHQVSNVLLVGPARDCRVHEQLRLDLDRAPSRRISAITLKLIVGTLSYLPARLPAGLGRVPRPRSAPWSPPAGSGLSSWAVFRRVQLPQLRVALLGGSLLVALHLLAEFGALQMLRYPTFTTAIYDQYRATFNGPGATMLAGVLVLLCLAAAARRAAAARTARLRAHRPRGRPARPRPSALGAAHRARPGRARPPSSSSPSSCRSAASATGWSPGPPPPSTGAVLTATTGTTLGPGRRRRGRRHRDGAAHRAGSPSARGVGVSTLLERSTYLGSAGAGHRRRPGAGDPEHPGHARGSTRPSRCCWPPTRSCSCRARS